MLQAVSISRRRRCMVYLLIPFVVSFLLVLVVYPLQNSTVFTKVRAGARKNADLLSPSQVRLKDTWESMKECPEVLTHMMNGSWWPRPHSYDEELAMLIFLVKSEARYRFPSNYQRHDGKCGNVTYELPEGNYANNFRALCDPLGLTPCCHSNKCLELSEYECFCDNCIDVRHDKHAEFSTWVPGDQRCKFKTFTSTEACRLLKGSVLHFVGDSFIRHLHTALLMVLTGDFHRGALKSGVSDNILGQCSGLYMFTEKTCQHQLNYSFQGCGGTVTVLLKYYFNSGMGALLEEETLRDLTSPRTMLVMGIASHDNYNSATVQNRFLLPLFQKMKNRNLKWPKLIWAEPHAPSVTMTREVLEKTRNVRKQFNSAMEMFLNSWRVPIFKTYNLTDGMSSFDGEHYGKGINLAKVQLLLNYIEELQRKGQW